jgi:pSer/pThr/pTyr-binding forkhead associated (FHA) protein
MLNLYPLPYTTLAPTVYHVYLHPEDYESIEPVAPRLVDQVHRALSDEVERINHGLRRTSRRVVGRLLAREELPPVEVPAAGWDVHIQADRNGELDRGQLGIVSTLAMPAPAEYGGTPTTRIVRSVVGSGHRSATVTDLPQPGAAPATSAPHPTAQAASAATPAPATTSSAGRSAVGDRARLVYADERGEHVFVMRKEAISIGRGGSSAWVDVQVVAASRVSREHVRLRHDPSGQFFVQDVSLWGTTVDGRPLPPAVKSADGVSEPGSEQPLPARARIGLADLVFIEFDAAAVV